MEFNSRGIRMECSVGWGRFFSHIFHFHFSIRKLFNSQFFNNNDDWWLCRKGKNGMLCMERFIFSPTVCQLFWLPFRCCLKDFNFVFQIVMMIDVVKREEKRMDKSLKQWHNLTLSISPFSTEGGGGMEKRTIRVICCTGILSNTQKNISQNNISP